MTGLDGIIEVRMNGSGGAAVVLSSEGWSGQITVSGF